MTRSYQKRREQFDFALFRELLIQKFGGRLPSGTQSRNPDFILPYFGETLGVEHTALCKTKGQTANHAPQEEVGFQDKIVNNARLQCEKWAVPPLRVKVWFRSTQHLRGRSDQQQVSHALANIVREFTQENTLNCFKWFKPESALSEISQIGITPGTINGKLWLKSHRWSRVGPVRVRISFIRDLQERIESKNAKYQKYLRKCDQCWLLIVADKSNPAQAFDITYDDQVQAHRYESKFDRTFFMEVTERCLVELNFSLQASDSLKQKKLGQDTGLL